MIAEFGLAALWLAAALALLQLIGAIAGVRECIGPAGAAVVRPAAVVQALLAGLSFLIADLAVRADRPVGAAGGEQFAFRKADDLQACRDLGQPRRIDAAVGYGHGALRAG